MKDLCEDYIHIHFIDICRRGEDTHTQTNIYIFMYARTHVRSGHRRKKSVYSNIYMSHVNIGFLRIFTDIRLYLKKIKFL